MSKRVSVKEASERLGMGQMAVRVRMERDLFNPPIGYVQPSLNGKRSIYLIYEDMLERFLKGV